MRRRKKVLASPVLLDISPVQVRAVLDEQLNDLWVRDGMRHDRISTADDEIVDEVAAKNLSPEQVAIVLELGGQDLKSTYKAELAGWVAGRFGTKGGVRVQLEAELQNALAKLKAECHPTDSQLKKLELAGRGDIKRFMDRLNQLAVEFDTSRGEGDEIEMIAIEGRKAKREFKDV